MDKIYLYFSDSVVKKFTGALREIGTYKETLRAEVKILLLLQP